MLSGLHSSKRASNIVADRDTFGLGGDDPPSQYGGELSTTGREQARLIGDCGFAYNNTFTFPSAPHHPDASAEDLAQAWLRSKSGTDRSRLRGLLRAHRLLRAVPLRRAHPRLQRDGVRGAQLGAADPHGLLVRTWFRYSLEAPFGRLARKSRSCRMIRLCLSGTSRMACCTRRNARRTRWTRTATPTIAGSCAPRTRSKRCVSLSAQKNAKLALPGSRLARAEG